MIRCGLAAIEVWVWCVRSVNGCVCARTGDEYVLDHVTPVASSESSTPDEDASDLTAGMAWAAAARLEESEVRRRAIYGPQEFGGEPEVFAPGWQQVRL